MFSYGFINTGQPAKTYIHQLCADTGCHLKDLLIEKDAEKELRESVQLACIEDDGDYLGLHLFYQR